MDLCAIVLPLSYPLLHVYMCKEFGGRVLFVFTLHSHASDVLVPRQYGRPMKLGNLGTRLASDDPSGRCGTNCLRAQPVDLNLTSSCGCGTGCVRIHIILPVSIKHGNKALHEACVYMYIKRSSDGRCRHRAVVCTHTNSAIQTLLLEAAVQIHNSCIHVAFMCSVLYICLLFLYPSG